MMITVQLCYSVMNIMFSLGTSLDYYQVSTFPFFFTFIHKLDELL